MLQLSEVVAHIICYSLEFGLLLKRCPVSDLFEMLLAYRTKDVAKSHLLLQDFLLPNAIDEDEHVHPVIILAVLAHMSQQLPVFI